MASVAALIRNRVNRDEGPWPLFQDCRYIEDQHRKEGDELACVDTDSAQKGYEDISGKLYDQHVSYLRCYCCLSRLSVMGEDAEHRNLEAQEREGNDAGTVTSGI